MVGPLRLPGICLFYCTFITIGLISGYHVDEVYFNALRSGKVKTKTMSRDGTIVSQESVERLEIFCYEPHLSPIFYKLWMSACFKIECRGHVIMRSGENASLAYDQLSYKQISLPWFLYSTSSMRCFQPFQERCLIVGTSVPFSITLKIEEYSLKHIFASCLGFLLFFLAEGLSKTPAFHFILGTTAGVLMFTVVIGTFMARYVLSVHKFQVAAFAVISTGLLVSCLDWMWRNLDLVCGPYLNYFLAYVAATSSVSFCVCYVRGPIENPRARRVIQWGLQLLAVATLYFSISYKPYGIVACAVLLAGGFVWSLV